MRTLALRRARNRSRHVAFAQHGGHLSIRGVANDDLRTAEADRAALCGHDAVDHPGPRRASLCGQRRRRRQNDRDQKHEDSDHLEGKIYCSDESEGMCGDYVTTAQITSVSAIPATTSTM